MKHTTTDHNEIKMWAEQHDGKPAMVSPFEEGGIRIDFPGHTDERLLSDTHQAKDISWEDFFKTFDEKHLTFVYEEPVIGTDPTSWYRFGRAPVEGADGDE